MSNREIRFRVRKKVRVTLEKYKWKLNGRKDSFVPAYVENFKSRDYPFPNADIKFFGLHENPDNLRSIFDLLFAIKKKDFFYNVEQVLQHRFHLLGTDFHLPSTINWNTNPQTGIEYPRLYFTLMDSYNTNQYGDVKYVWELNRQQYLIELGKAYYLTQEERYAEKIWSCFETWTNDNSYKIGINYTSALEHAVRIFAWVWAYFFTKESLIWTKERKEILVKNLILQGFFIEENLSYYFSPYNHLVGELAALSFLGTILSNEPKMKIWRDKYWQELERELQNQLHSDGFTVEQASYYHHFTIGFYLMVAILRKQNNLAVSESVWGKLEQALEFSMCLTRPDGSLPMLGDIDNARSIYFYRPEDQWNLRPFLSIGAVLFRRGDFKFVSKNNTEEVLWLFGERGTKIFDELGKAEPKDKSFSFPESGYFIMRDGWHENNNYCCFDCGEIADGIFKDETPSAAHGHADMLSFELCLNGKPVIVDPGFHTYFGSIEWHRYFRSSRGHNTIEVNGSGQATHEGRIGWSNVSSPKLDCWTSIGELDFASGAIDRFAKLQKSIFHRRYILFRKEKYFLIIDEVDGDSSGKNFGIESSFHFNPGKLSYNGNQLKYDDNLISILSIPEDALVQIDNGGKNPDQGWIAKGYGYREIAPVLRILANQSLPAYFGMIFPIDSISDDRSFQFNLAKMNHNLLCCDIQFDNVREKVYLNPAGKKFSIGPFENDAFCLVESKDIYFIKVSHVQSSKYDVNYSSEKQTGVNLKVNFESGKPNLEVWE